MGNAASAEATESTMEVPNNMAELPAEVMDIMATRFITSEQSAANSGLSNADYCNNLVGQLSDVIYDSTRPAQIVYLSQLRSPPNPESPPDTLSTVEENCQELAKFYTQIAQVYRAIYGAIRPRVVEKGGKSVTIMANPCSERIAALLGESGTADDIKEINPAYCSINKDARNLAGVPGLAALDYLYHDKYNPATNSYDSMTDETAELYGDTVQKLQHAYTGLPLKDSSVTSFADIKLKDFAADPGCAEDVLVGNREHSVEDLDKEFREIVKAHEATPTGRTSSRQRIDPPWGGQYGNWPWGGRYGYGAYYAPQPRGPVTAPPLDNKLLPSRRDVIEYINDYLRREGLRTHSSTDLDTLLQQLPDPSGEIEDWPANLKNYIAEYRTLRRGKLEHELTSQKKRWLAGNPDDKQRERGAQGSGVYRQASGMKDNAHLEKYVEGIKAMEKGLFKAQKKLLRVLDELFVYIQLPESGTKAITINPNLTHSRLEKDVIPMVRETIRNLYSSCEEDFTRLVKMYETAVAKQQAIVLTKQIKFLESGGEYEI